MLKNTILICTIHRQINVSAKELFDFRFVSGVTSWKNALTTGVANFEYIEYQNESRPSGAVLINNWGKSCR